MNAFILSSDPIEAAQMLDDKRALKLVLEEAQILSTAHRVLDGFPVNEFGKDENRVVVRYHLKDLYLDKVLCKSAYPNHPLNLWARESSENYLWIYKYFCTLLNEFKFRYKHPHSFEKYIDILNKLPKNIPIKEQTPFAQCMPEKYKNIDAVIAYRNYFIGEKLSTAKWNKGREKPEWLNNYE